MRNKEVGVYSSFIFNVCLWYIRLNLWGLRGFWGPGEVLTFTDMFFFHYKKNGLSVITLHSAQTATIIYEQHEHVSVFEKTTLMHG